MRLLLGSGGLSTEARRAAWWKALDEFLGPVDRFLFIPWALQGAERYARMLVERGFHAGREVLSIHEAPDPRKAVREAPAVYVGGGNTFRLLDRCQRAGILPLLRRRAAAGMPYVGISAGTNLACPTIRTTNDMPIVWPKSARALGLVPFQINPHYVDGAFYLRSGRGYRPYGGETRDTRLHEFHEENDLPILALREGSVLRVEGARARLDGSSGARLFRPGRPPRDYPVGARLSSLLRPS